MRNFMFFLCVLICSLNTNAQNVKSIKADSLLILFSNTTDVFEVLDQINIYEIDYFDCYNNNNIKPLVLKWIDKNQYFEHLNSKFIKRVYNDDYKLYKVVGWLENHGQKHLKDSVLKTQELFDTYLDSVIRKVSLERKQIFFKNGGKLDEKALSFFSQLKLSEAYKVIKQHWVDDKMKVQGAYFEALLAMHDPDAISRYSTFIDSILNNQNVIEIKKLKDIVNNEYLFGSLSIDFKLKLLKETQVIPDLLLDFGEGGIDCPYNLFFLNTFFVDNIFYKSDNPIVKRIIAELYYPDLKIEKIGLKQLIKISNEVVENYDEFEKVALEYKKVLEEKEKYWKLNMPYQKK